MNLTFINKIKKKYFTLNGRQGPENLTFCIYLSKCLFGIFPKKDFAWKKVSTKRPVFKDHRCEQIRQAPGRPAVPLQLEDESGPEESSLQGARCPGFLSPRHLLYFF